MIIAQLADLAENAELRRALAPLFPDDRLAEFAKTTGIRLDRCASALVAQFDYATLYLARTQGENDSVEELFTQRLVSEPIRASVHPKITRVTGIVGRTPETLVRVDDDFMGVSVGDPAPARIVELFALGRLRKSPPALRGAALSTLPADLDRAPLRGYAPGPFSGEWASGARGLLSATIAAAAAVYPEGSSVRLVAVLTGDFGDSNGPFLLAQSWDDVAQSPVGRLLGLDHPVREPLVSQTASGLQLDVTLAMGQLAEGLHSAVGADIREMMSFSRLPAAPSPSGPP